MSATLTRYACTWPRCRFAPYRCIRLRGRVTGNFREWYACERHTGPIRDMVQTLWLARDRDGVMTFEEDRLP